jgi:hypothetical protein
MCPPPLLFRNLLIQPDFDSFHVLSTNHPQLYQRIRCPFSKLLPPYDASIFGCAARFDLSTPPMNSHRFQAPPVVGQLLPSARTADLSEDGKPLDSDNNSLPSVKQILASSKRAKRVIDLTGNYDNDGEGGDDDFTEVSWLRTTQTARYLVRLIPPFIDRIRIAGQLRSPYTALSDKVTGTYCRRSRNVVYGGHTWQEEKPLGEYPAVVPIAPQTSTAFR